MNMVDGCLLLVDAFEGTEGIRGASATALAVFLAKHGQSKETIKKEIEYRFGYNLTISLDTIRPTYYFDVSCQGTVPVAIRAFLESWCYEDAIRNAISVGGDSDTIAAIAGGIAEAYYGVPEEYQTKVRDYLTPDLLEIVDAFRARFMTEAAE